MSKETVIFNLNPSPLGEKPSSTLIPLYHLDLEFPMDLSMDHMLFLMIHLLLILLRHTTEPFSVALKRRAWVSSWWKRWSTGTDTTYQTRARSHLRTRQNNQILIEGTWVWMVNRRGGNEHFLYFLKGQWQHLECRRIQRHSVNIQK